MSAEIHYLAGLQDSGHRIMARILDADENLYLLMESEARALGKRENAETEAVHATAGENVTT
jgi:hypothetical protein